MQIPFQPNTFYHIYNRAIGDEKAFRETKNYHFFLQKLKHYIAPIANVYAYCLLPNHYHLLIKSKSEQELDNYKTVLKKENILRGNFETYDHFLLQQFSNMGNSYTKAFNKMYNRKGRLFMESLKRKEVATDEYFSKVIHYIHANPVHHGLANAIEKWQHSSYHAFLKELPTLLQRDEVLEWFNGLEGFIKFHQQPISKRLGLDDDVNETSEVFKTSEV